jgi:AcrR family transcriptional regulator
MRTIGSGALQVLPAGAGGIPILDPDGSLCYYTEQCLENYEMPMDRQLAMKEKRAVKRRRILDAAGTLVDEHGLEHLSLRETAGQAGFSPAGVYEYFRDKDEIIEALALDGLASLAARFSSIPRDLDPREEMIAMGLAYVRFAQERTELFKLIFSGRLCPRGSKDEPPPVNSPYAMLLRTVVRASRAGIVQAETPAAIEDAAYALWTQMHGMAMLRATYLRNFQTDFEAMHRHALSALVAGL